MTTMFCRSRPGWRTHCTRSGWSWIILLAAVGACKQPRVAITPTVVFAVPGQWFELDLHYRDKEGTVVRDLNTVEGLTIELSVGPSVAKHDDKLADAVTRIRGVSDNIVDAYHFLPVIVTVDAPDVDRVATALIYFINESNPPPGDRFIDQNYQATNADDAMSPTSLVISANNSGLWQNQFFRTAVSIAPLGSLRKAPAEGTERIGIFYERGGATVQPSTAIWTDLFEVHDPDVPAVRETRLHFWIAFEPPITRNPTTWGSAYSGAACYGPPAPATLADSVGCVIKTDVQSATYDFGSSSVGMGFEATGPPDVMSSSLRIQQLGLWPLIDPPECYTLFTDPAGPALNQNETHVIIVESMPWDQLKGWTCSNLPGKTGRIIFLHRDFSEMTLTHELGHAMGLTYPRGHINAMPQFDRGNFMHTELENAYYFSVGQAYHMNLPSTTGPLPCIDINAPIFSKDVQAMRGPC